MSEKHLTEPPWKALAAKQKVKDLGLGKALSTYDKCEEKDYAGRLEALDGIDKYGASLKKEHAKEKEIADYLAEVLKESDKSRKALALLAKSEAKDSEDEGDEDEEAEEYKKDLKKKLVSALAQVKSRAPGAPEPGQDQQPQLQFMAYVASRASAVLVAKKIGGGSKKLLPSIADGASGGTYYRGECIFEKSAHTFVLDQVPGGMAKKLSKAILAETGQKYKVRVRSTDGSVELDGDTDTDLATETDPPPGTGAVDLAAQWRQVKLALYPEIKKALEGNPPNRDEILKLAGEAQRHEKAGTFQSAIDAFIKLRTLLGGVSSPSLKTEADLAARWKQVKLALYPKIKEALGRNPPNRDAILKLVGDATRYEKETNFKSAIQAFVELRPLLGGSGSGEAGQPERETEEKEGSAPAPNLAVWTKAKDQVSAEINTLCDFLRKLEWEDESEEDDKQAVTEAARMLAAATEQSLVNVKWTAALTSFDQAGAAQRRQLWPGLRQTLAEYKASIQADPALTAAEDHPMVPVNAKKPLLAALDTIQKNLESQMAA